MNKKKIYIFAKEGLSQNLIHLAIAELSDELCFYHQLESLQNLDFSKKDIFIFDDSLIINYESIRVWFEKIKNLKCVFLFSEVDWFNQLEPYGIILKKPFAPQELKKAIL